MAVPRIIAAALLLVALTVAIGQATADGLSVPLMPQVELCRHHFQDAHTRHLLLNFSLYWAVAKPVADLSFILTADQVLYDREPLVLRERSQQTASPKLCLRVVYLLSLPSIMTVLCAMASIKRSLFNAP